MLHRYGSVAAELARRLLALQPGDRLASVAQLAAEFGTGHGTIQSALKLLIDDGAVQLERRGALGSFIAHLDRERLLALAELPTVIGAMPVAYSLRFQGLATGLTRAFAQAEVPLVLAQVRGGRNRIHLLRTGRCDFAIISRLAWEQEAAAGDLQLVLSFGPGSNVGDHVLLIAAGGPAQGIRDGMRVGVDPSSHDHLRLTLAECQGKAVQLVEISYAQTIAKLLAREIDAALWDAGVPVAYPGLVTLPRQHREADDTADTEAVLVVRAADAGLGALIGRRIDPGLVTEVQQRVVAGAEVPLF